MGKGMSVYLRINLCLCRTQVRAAPPTKRPASKTQAYPPSASSSPFGQLTRQLLPAFVQHFNHTNPDINMSIWTPTNSTVGQNGLIRIVVPDILVGYINLRSLKGHHDLLGVETVSVTGIREQVRVSPGYLCL